MTQARAVYPADRIALREVGLRDGLQLVKAFPATDAKAAWIAREFEAGIRHFELGSFLPPSRFPQFADLSSLIEIVATLDGAHGAGLALNERGVEDAITSGIGEIGCVVSATEEHSQANMKRSRSDAVALVATAAEKAREASHRPLVNAGIAMAFGCSIAGEVAPDEVVRLAADCLEAGADMVGLADTVGYAGPKQVGSLCDRLVRLAGDAPVVIHLHDTRGMGIANAAAALDAGVRILDGSLGGLGGCPFAPGATGNVVLEDLVFLCERMGFHTGADLAALREVRVIAEKSMPGEAFHGALTAAGPPPLIDWKA